MTLFQPSLKAVSAACREIADSVGASADSEMLVRAGNSLNASLQHFNNRANWNFMLSEGPTQTVLAPFTVTGITASAGAASAACPTGHGILPDDFVVGNGFGVGMRVSATAAGGFGFYGLATGFTGTATASAGFTRDMYSLPADFKAPYNFRLLGSQRYLIPVGRRLYDRSISSEQTNGSVYYYDVFMFGSRGKIRVLPSPAGADVLQTRYYRRMTMMDSAVGTADTAALDIPQDFELYLVSWAKWHFLTDKADVPEKRSQTWLALAEEGLKTMVQFQTRQPDEDLRFIPGQFSGLGNYGDNTVGFVDWSY